MEKNRMKILEKETNIKKGSGKRGEWKSQEDAEHV